MGVCEAEGCEEALSTGNASGYCSKFHRNNSRAIKRQQERRPSLAATLAWLAEVGLAGSPDPNVVLLCSVAKEMDDLDEGLFDITDHQLIQAKKAARHAIAQARKALQATLDKADSVAVKRRHRLVYGRIAAESLGWIDTELLSDSLRAAVFAYLGAEHGIEPEDYDPSSEKL